MLPCAARQPQTIHVCLHVRFLFTFSLCQGACQHFMLAYHKYVAGSCFGLLQVCSEAPCVAMSASRVLLQGGGGGACSSLSWSQPCSGGLSLLLSGFLGLTRDVLVRAVPGPMMHVLPLCRCHLSLQVYPVVVHWVWTKWGWLSAFNPQPLLGAGAIDFAGRCSCWCSWSFCLSAACLLPASISASCLLPACRQLFLS
jgi:hypothetical protein